MSRGKKLDFNLNENFDDEWGIVQDKPKAKKDVEVLLPEKHFLYTHKEKRKGKWVTLIGPFSLENDIHDTYLKKAKKALGCGGKITLDKNGKSIRTFFEFQGDISEKVNSFFKKENFRFKK
jgi:translation initiation factor 1